MSLRDQLNSYVQRLEKRLRLGAWFRGAAILTSVALVATLVLVLIANAFAFSRGSVTGARIALVFALVLAATFGIALPLRALNRKRAAHEAEAVFPQFKQRLVTFTERGASREPFLELLAADTLEVARDAEPKNLVSDRKLLAFLGAGVVSLSVLLWMILAGPGYWGHGAALLWATAPREAAPFYDLRVKPGDAAVRRSTDQMVIAELIGLQTQKVNLYAKYQSASKWEQVPMRPDPDGSSFEFVFAGLPENVEYYVEAGPLQSKHFNIRVLDLPEVKNIRVTYQYPEWTHMQTVTEERGGDLRAIEGTDASLEIQTDRPLPDGLLMVNDDQQIHLSGGNGNVYNATVHIDQDGVFHVAAMDQGQPVRLSNDYFIEAQKANPPDVIIARPGGDYRASPIEEVTVEVKANDAFGVNDMTLHYSVNGGEEKTVDLLKQKGAKQADGSTVISLEDFKLVPGDLVTLYATAKDSRMESRTDMAFIQAEPFERNFSQSQQMGGGVGGGGGGAGGQDQDISQREKEIIASTWRQHGDIKATKQQSADTAKFLSDVQAKLRDQARSLSGRMNSRELSRENDEFSGFVKDMNAAADAMEPAAEELKAEKWNEAVPDEQKALQHLLRAEATFRDIEVAFGNQGGGGGGSGGAGRDLASLFDLELDTEKNQYETAQTANSQDQKQKDIDEALQKLDELARRQQELAQQPQPNGPNSEQRWQQEMLRREAEQLQQQMEQMSRNGANSQNGSASSSSSSGQASASGGQGQAVDPRVQKSLDQLRQATDDMRRATSPEQSEAEARRAADRLKDAQDTLGGIRQQETSSRLNSVADETDRLSKEQEDQAQRMSQLAENSGAIGGNQQDLRKLADDRQKLAQDLGNLEKQMDDTVRDLANSKQMGASSKLRDALGDFQEDDLRARVQRDSDWIRRGVDPNINGGEDQVTQGMQRLDKDVHDALQAAGSGPENNNNPQQGLETALNRVEQLRNEMNQLTRNPQPGQPGQPGQGQPGQAGQRGSQYGGGGPAGGGGATFGNGAYGPYGGDYNGDYGGGYWRGGVYWNFDTGNNTPLGRANTPPNTSPIPPEQAYQESLRELNQLRQTVRQQPDPEVEKEIQDLINQMQHLDPSRFPGNPALVEQLHTQVLAEVDKVELELRRQLDEKETGQVRSADSRPVPAGYEDSVADYYRRLSKTK